MYLFSSKKTKISADYNGDTVNFELCPFDTLSHLKEVSIQYFPEITFNPVFYHQSKPLSDYDDLMRLSELTKGKTFIHLTIEKQTQLFSSKGMKRLSYDNSISIKTKCSCRINSCNAIGNSNNENTISFFCINCREFICLNCKTNHDNHRRFIFDIYSTEDSAKSFAISLQAEISNELNKYKEIDNMFKSSLLIDFNSWKKEIICKLNQIELIFKSFKHFELILSSQMDNIERMAMDTFNKIEKKLNNYLNEKKKSNDIDKAIDVFKYISNSREVIEFVSKENESRKEEFEANKAINELLINLKSSLEDIEQLSKTSYIEIQRKFNMKGNSKENNKENSHVNIDDCLNSSLNFNVNTRLNTMLEKDIKHPEALSNIKLSQAINRKKIATPFALRANKFSKYLQLDKENDIDKDIAILMLSSNKATKTKKGEELGHSLMLPNIKII